MAHLHQRELGPGGHHLDGVAGLDGALEHADVDDNALVAVVDGVEDQRFQRRGGSPVGRDVLGDTFQHIFDADAQLGGNTGRLHAGQADDILDLFGNGVRVGAGQIDLVQDGHDLQVMVKRQIAVGQCLGLHALAGVHHQYGTLAGGQTAADLVLKVHMAPGYQ